MLNKLLKFLLRFLSKTKERDILKDIYTPQNGEKNLEKSIEVKKAFIEQFAENQNHQQRLFIQFLSSVLIVIVAYVFVYSNTAMYSGIKIYKSNSLAKIETSDTATIKQKKNPANLDSFFIKSDIYNSTKHENGTIFSFSLISLVGIYIFSQIVFLVLCTMILHMGYSYRRDQLVVYRIRKNLLGKSEYEEIFGEIGFKSTGKGFFEYLPNFNSTLFFAIFLIQVILFTSIYVFFNQYPDTQVLSENILYHSVTFKGLRISMIFPVFVNLFLYTFYFNKYDSNVNLRNTFLPKIEATLLDSPLAKKHFKVMAWVYCIMILILLYVFFFITKIIFIITIILFSTIILLPVWFYGLYKKFPEVEYNSRIYQSLCYGIFGTLLFSIAFYYFIQNKNHFVNFDSVNCIIISTVVIFFILTPWYFKIKLKQKNFEKTIFFHFVKHNRFFRLLIFYLILIFVLRLRWVDCCLSGFFGCYSFLVGRRIFNETRLGRHGFTIANSPDSN